MELLKFIPLFVVIVTMVTGRRMLTEQTVRHLLQEQAKLLAKDPLDGPVMCARLAKEPYFILEILLDRAWRIYYSWNINLEKQCMDMTFRNATPSIINRIHQDMSEYLKVEPKWDTATMVVRLGRTKHEMLLFEVPGSAGKFHGVPNVIRDGSSPAVLSVPELNFQLKLMYGGKYLLMADCQLGVVTLSAHRKNIPHRGEIANIAKNLDFGPGSEACKADRSLDEKAIRK